MTCCFGLLPVTEVNSTNRSLLAPQFLEKLGAVEHGILVDPKRQAYYGPDPKSFPMHENCRYTAEGVTCKVPAGHYFMMGDNRDNSSDSRDMSPGGVGYVPFENFIGRAEIIFFSAKVDEPDAFRWYAPWRWPFDIRWDRFFKLVR